MTVLMICEKQGATPEFTDTSKVDTRVVCDAREMAGRLLDVNHFLASNCLLYHASHIQLYPGQVLVTGELQDHPHHVFFVDPPPSDLMCVADYRARRECEAVFEEVRHVRFPDYPSRRCAVFANLTMGDAEFWRTKSARHAANIYQIEARGDSRLLVASITWFNYAVRVHKGLTQPEHVGLSIEKTISGEIAAAADHYWRGLSFEQYGAGDKYEVLIDGEVEVVLGPL